LNSRSNEKNESGRLVLEIFRALEQRDDEKFRTLLHPEFEIHWPPSLPYGKSGGPTWSETWAPLQPTDAERRMDPRVVASTENEVIVLYQQRGISPAGERFEGEVLGLYQLCDGKLVRAQMFYFNTHAVASFLAKALKKD
jgi:ketosteroid isomerase-like protein